MLLDRRGDRSLKTLAVIFLFNLSLRLRFRVLLGACGVLGSNVALPAVGTGVVQGGRLRPDEVHFSLLFCFFFSSS